MRRLVTVCFVVLAFVFCVPVVHAQNIEDDGRSRSERTYDECVNRKFDVLAYQELKEEGLIEGTVTGDVLGAVQGLKEDNPELFEKKLADLHEEKANDPGFEAKLFCNLEQPFNKAGDWVDEKTEGFWGDPIGALTKAMMEGNAEFMQLAMTFWMDFEVLSANEVAANVEGVKNIVWGIAGFALIASFMVGGTKLAASRRSGLHDGAEEIGLNVGRWLIFSLCIPVIVPSALIASDILAQEIMNSFGATSPDTFVQMTAFEDTAAGPIVMFVLTLIAIAGSAMQILALVIRVLVLPIAAGLAPLFAALSFSEMGRSGLHHLVGYMIAAVAYKPVAALLYAVVLWNVTRPGSGDEFIGAVINALMIAVVGFLAPQLVRMITPMVAQAGGAGAGAALGAAAGATGAAIGVAGAAVGAVTGGVGGAVGGMAGKAVSGAGGGAARSAGAPVSAGGGKTSGGSGGSSGVSGGSSGGRSGSGGAVSTKSQPAGARASGGSRFRRSPAGIGHRASGAGRGAISGAVKGVAAGRRVGGMVGQAGSSVRTLENAFEGSLGYPGQVHR